jgi:hypothetical protein
VTTNKVKSPTDDFSDALFLVNNPSWTYRDLQDTPARVVELVQSIQQGREQVAEARQKSGGN